MNRIPLRLAVRALGALCVALATLVLVFGVLVAPAPADMAPSAIKKLYDPTDL
jgi:hypothetical protein